MPSRYRARPSAASSLDRRYAPSDMDEAQGPSLDPADRPTADESREPVSEPLNVKDSFGTAIGAAMLGFEQALRREPPAEVLAAEYVPERGQSGDDSGLIIEFPDPVDEA